MQWHDPKYALNVLINIPNDVLWLGQTQIGRELGLYKKNKKNYVYLKTNI